MTLKRFTLVILICLAGFVFLTGPGYAKKPSLDAWKPAFNYKKAKYKCIVSNVGFAIRDELWKKTNGRIYIDYKPFSMLGGEVEVLNQLQMGAIQGMGVSSVTATNLGPRFGLVNLPFLINSFDKLDKFVASGKLFDHYMMATDHIGIMGLDITGYGNYGWATTKPVTTSLQSMGAESRGHALARCTRGPETGSHHRSGPHPHRLQHHQKIRGGQELHHH